MFPGNIYFGEFSISTPVPQEEGPGSLETMSYLLESLKDKSGRLLYVAGYKEGR